jgi:hypothetical protein
LSQNIFFKKVFIVIIKNLHQSNAGIGSKLNTHKFIEIIAAIINKNIIPALNEFATKSTIQIGHFIFFTASSLSVSVFGLNIFCHKIQIHLKVNKLWLYVSKDQYFIESINQYLYSKSLFTEIFEDK